MAAHSFFMMHLTGNNIETSIKRNMHLNCLDSCKEIVKKNSRCTELYICTTAYNQDSIPKNDSLLVAKPKSMNFS